MAVFGGVMEGPVFRPADARRDDQDGILRIEIQRQCGLERRRGSDLSRLPRRAGLAPAGRAGPPAPRHHRGAPRRGLDLGRVATVGMGLGHRWPLATATANPHLLLALGRVLPCADDGRRSLAGEWRSMAVRATGSRCARLRGPRVVLELLEAAYLGVYLVLPAGFAVARALDPSLDADRFWPGVVVATLASYGMLPWIQTRPPRAIADHMAIDGRDLAIRRVNLAVLDRGSIHVNTFPSGHAAGATAIAIAVAAVSPVAGAVFAILAAGIVLGSIAGRYHYALDSLAGILVAVLTWLSVGGAGL